MRGLAPIGLISVAAALTACDREPPVDPPLPATPDTLPPATTADALQGQALYVQHCLLCHQQDGGGVPNMQPSLLENNLVAGEPGPLIEIVLKGIGGLPPALPDSGDYGVVMPGLPTLSDEEIANLLTYIRQAFSPAEPVTPEMVAAVRALGG